MAKHDAHNLQIIDLNYAPESKKKTNYTIGNIITKHKGFCKTEAVLRAEFLSCGLRTRETIERISPFSIGDQRYPSCQFKFIP
jgi:hypothetical protein